MAKLNLDYYTGIDQYNDKEEDLLLAHYRGETRIEHARDSLFYLTTGERENILAWYPFENKDVLEIGCGCGCITGTLCDSSKSVIAVDQSKKRAQITFERHKKRDNLNVYAGNIIDVKFDKRFDYIVLIGVLEYAKRFFSESPEDEFFLKKIRELLKPEGVLLIAIENRYGIKYFAGANEDHLGKPYISLQGYSNTDVKTYGKMELERLLGNCGFTKTRFYYPFPDYKLPSMVYSDHRLPSHTDARLLPIYTYGNAVSFPIQEVLSGLIDNGEFGFFSNSFLVEAGTGGSIFSDIVYAKFQPARTEKYQIVSVEREGKRLSKRPRGLEAKAHLENYQRIHEKVAKAGIAICQVSKTCSEDEWEIEYVEGESISEMVDQAGENNGKNGILREIRKLIDYLYSVSELAILDQPIFEDLKGVYPEPTYILKYGLMDLNASNILFSKKTGYTLIDQEWEESKQVPTDYAVMNSIGYLYTACAAIKNYYSLEKLLKEFGLSLDKVTVLEKIADAYFKKEHAVLDEDKCLIFEQLNRYDIVQPPEQTKQMQLQLQEKNQQVAHLSENYLRVVNQISELERQLIERNEKVAYLSENYLRVVDRLTEIEKRNKHRKK